MDASGAKWEEEHERWLSLFPFTAVSNVMLVVEGVLFLAGGSGKAGHEAALPNLHDVIPNSPVPSPRAPLMSRQHWAGRINGSKTQTDNDTQIFQVGILQSVPNGRNSDAATAKHTHTSAWTGPERLCGCGKTVKGLEPSVEVGKRLDIS